MTDLEKRQMMVPLGPWLELCKNAGIPHVSAMFSPEFPIEQIYIALNGPGSGPTRQLDAAFRWYESEKLKRLKAGHRFSARWECCSNSMAKEAAGNGWEWDSDYYELTCDDSRVMDCTAGNTTTTRLCVRPWMDTPRADDYPVECRVFVDYRYGIIGISNYYPQRPLTFQDCDGQVHAWMHLVLQRTRRLADAVRDKHGEGMGFTADWLLTGVSDCVFLEGGPPHEESGHVSAHPCCFAPGKIEGIALARREGALEY